MLGHDKPEGKMTVLTPESQKLKDAIESGKCKMLDSIFSPLTRRLIKKFASDGVDMTDLWIRTPQFWTCPGCGREKEQIVRLNAKNQLMCRLVEHHDHMKDLLLERFRNISASLKIVVADEKAERFAKRSVSMVSSYDNTVICEDCNAADGKAKKIVPTHIKYSYSSNEIRQFIYPRANQPHEINIEVANRIWGENKKTFALRLRIIERIAQIAATNEHWYQEVDRRLHSDTIISVSEGTLREYGIYLLPYYELRGETQNIDRDYSAWRKKKPGKTILPTEGEVNHAAKVTSAVHWRLVGDDWQCPVCKRKKHEIVRKNNKSEWSFSLSTKWYKDTSEVLGKKRHTICNDCGWVAERLAEEANMKAGSNISHYSSWIELDDIATVIIPNSNVRHEIKNKDADLVVSSLISIMQNA